MSVDVRVPSMGESVKTATIARWLKKPGDWVKMDESLVELDSDKASVELPSPAAGQLADQLAASGDDVSVGQVIAHITPGQAPAAQPEASAPAATASPATAPNGAAAAKNAAPVAAAVAAPTASGKAAPAGPAVRKAMRDAGVEAVPGSGKGGRVLRADVDAAAARRGPVADAVGDEPVEIVPMTNLRKKIAQRLVEAQQNSAILTTFNEVDMSAVMALRERYQDRFVKKYGIKLGFMGFFTKAAVEALKTFPSANAEIRGTDIVYKHYYHVGVAVSGPRGLVVPVVRHADQLSFAETEQVIAEYGQKARDNRLTVDDLQGGTFTISNGGIFGSMMSTPILNAPQVAILGMHAIQKRAVVVDDQIVIRPMMYLAVSYDHRLLDGREAVSFLVRIKECIEAPERMLLEI
ncbi:MAG: 2-oxoglutarate dehydrogenase complex dihydrolipoyllysine-residue succinyltransferase [Pseudomonadota bacterium]|nr:2-oxoglutarate dehydrogenase complex dihydrolipoyllysine-residue succinyltransferase [Pseudomonadota bacterium]